MLPSAVALWTHCGCCFAQSPTSAKQAVLLLVYCCAASAAYLRLVACDRAKHASAPRHMYTAQFLLRSFFTGWRSRGLVIASKSVCVCVCGSPHHPSSAYHLPKSSALVASSVGLLQPLRSLHGLAVSSHCSGCSCSMGMNSKPSELSARFR